jgi:hypothetical protein
VDDPGCVADLHQPTGLRAPRAKARQLIEQRPALQ